MAQVEFFDGIPCANCGEDIEDQVEDYTRSIADSARPFKCYKCNCWLRMKLVGFLRFQNWKTYLLNHEEV